MSRTLHALVAALALTSGTACLATIDDSLVDKAKPGGTQPDAPGADKGDPGSSKTTPGATKPAAQGLVGYWSFDEAGGNAVADATGRHDGVVSGLARRTKGVRGNGLNLDGKQNFSVAALDGAAFPAEGTLSMHVLVSFGASNTRNVGVFDVDDDTRAHVSISLPSGASTQIWTHFTPATSTPTLAALSWDEWRFVVVTWSATKAELFVEGSKTRVIDLSKFAPSEQRFVFGDRLEGAIDEIALYDQVLDPETLPRVR
jgi:hypothetical protein